MSLVSPIISSDDDRSCGFGKFMNLLMDNLLVLDSQGIYKLALVLLALFL